MRPGAAAPVIAPEHVGRIHGLRILARARLNVTDLRHEILPHPHAGHLDSRLEAVHAALDHAVAVTCLESFGVDRGVKVKGDDATS